MSGFASMGMVGLGSMITASAQLQAGREAEATGYSQQNIQNYNAETLIKNAVSEKEASLFNQMHQTEQASRLKSTVKAMAGASGTVASEGSNIQAVAETAENTELDNMLMGYESIVKQRQLMSQAAEARRYGVALAKAGVSARRASYWQATATILQGFGGAASAWPSSTSTGSNGTSTPYSFGGTGSPITSGKYMNTAARNF